MTTPFRQIDPQPARGKLKESMWSDDQWVAEEKYDGDRRVAQFIGPVVRFTGRRQSVDGSGFVEKSANVPHLSGVFEGGLVTAGQVDAWRNPNVPGLDGTVLDGEMLFTGPCEGGGRSKYVTSIMGSLPEEAVRKQLEVGWLRYVVFDCLWFKGKFVADRPYRERREYLESALKEWGNQYVEAAAQFGGEVKQKAYDRIIETGGEGIILKHVNSKYGERTKWVKVKGTWNADVVITGYQAAKELSVKKGDDAATMTKYAAAGLIGAIVCGQYSPVAGDKVHEYELIEVATISGMDDALRTELSRNGPAYLGRVVEIAHNGREPTGRFRHPRFKQFRDDKAPTACMYGPDEK